MRYLITILTLITVSTYGQKTYTGTYFTTKKDIGFESDIFQFEKDGSFRYIFFTCTGTGLGKGKYEITKGDSLRLQFTDCIACEEFKEIETFSDSSDNLEIDLQIVAWEDNSGIAGANVYFPKAQTGTVADQNGNARFIMPRLSETQMLRIQFVGYDPLDIEIPKQTSRVNGVIRLSYNWVYDRTEIKTFKILHWTKLKLKLQRYPEVIISYDKVNPTKTDKLIEDRLGELGYHLYKDKICAPNNKTNTP
jgi:CarboxypepD_reg-like domain